MRSGDKIAISANANTPRAFLDALFARAEQLEQAEVNARMPQTYGPVRLPLASADAVIETDRPLPENPRPVITDVERQLGAHVAALIRDGDCLQVGGGAVPAAVAGG